MQMLDNELLKQNLDSLMELNEKNKLFENQFFNVHIRVEFIKILLYALTEKINDSSREEMVSMIYFLSCIKLNLILAVDFIQFYNNFIPNFLASFRDINIKKYPIQVHTDSSGFSSQLNMLIDDITFFSKPNGFV
jgi:hypothetical protein